TNKLASICGTTVSSTTYYRRVRPDPRTFVPLMLLAFLGSAVGAVVASQLPRSAFDPIVLVVLILVGTYVVLSPKLGQSTVLRFSGHRHTAAAMATGLAIGFYDGALGPGTGSFFVFTLVGLLGYNFLEASAKARMANWATNLGALVIFVPQGGVLWKVGLVMGAANLVGGYVGARTAVSRGSRFVRVFFVVVVSAFVVRIGGDVLGVW
ncbi:MAG: sulfite exporter TauE/SafE family protein, partial [Nocardioides sp.]|nr:sulfite exporter TauE/SafE family protein [Nocardioides sp.]